MSIGSEFRLNSLSSLEEIDKATTAVHANREKDLGVFATALDKRRGALRDAAFLQVLLTWARLNPQRSLNLLSNGDKTRESVLVEACGHSVGLALLSMAPFIKVLGESVQRYSALSSGAERIESAYQGDFKKLMKGRTIDLLCVSGAERQFLKPLFYAPDPSAVRDKFDLKATIRGLSVLSHAKTADVVDDGTTSALATLTHELFENTQDHAITGLDGKKYRRHVELMLASWLSFSDDESKADLIGSQSLKNYWAALSARFGGERQVAGICFSFLDSGPGMASRLLGKEYVAMTKGEERDALENCLRQSFSSKTKKATGGGIPEVLLEVAQASGFVRVRSGRHAIFKCFPPNEPIANVCENFEDWYDDGRELMRVAGTVISVFIPLPRL